MRPGSLSAEFAAIPSFLVRKQENLHRGNRLRSTCGRTSVSEKNNAPHFLGRAVTLEMNPRSARRLRSNNRDRRASVLGHQAKNQEVSPNARQILLRDKAGQCCPCSAESPAQPRQY